MMKKTKENMTKTMMDGLLLLASLAMLLLVAAPASAQQRSVTATATITLTVVRAPGVNFSPATTNRNGASLQQSTSSGITLHASTNVRVTLSSAAGKSRLDLQADNTRTFTAHELNGVSSVEMDYIGS